MGPKGLSPHDRVIPGVSDPLSSVAVWTWAMLRRQRGHYDAPVTKASYWPGIVIQMLYVIEERPLGLCSSGKGLCKPMFRILVVIYSFCIWGVWGVSFAAPALPPYTINAGDLLQVSVWKEPDLQVEALVRPDGGLSLPLIGDVAAAGKTVEAVRQEIAKRIDTYVPDAVVTVALKQLSGDKIYVLGKVNRPGEYGINRYVDVMQALSIAGGTTTFADLDDIVILRRNGDGQRALEFKYSQVSRGKHLEQNIILQSGDVVVVP